MTQVVYFPYFIQLLFPISLLRDGASKTVRFAKTLEHIIHIDYYYHQPPSNNSPNLYPYTTLPSTVHYDSNNTKCHHLASLPYMQNNHTDNDTSTYDAYQNKAPTKWPPTVTTRSSTPEQSILKVRLWSEQLVKGRPRLKQRLWPSTLRRLQQHQPQLHSRPSSSVVQNRRQQPQRLRPRLESSKFQASQNHDDTEKSSAWLLV